MSNEEIQQRCGISATGVGPMRRDLAHIRSPRRERYEAIGEKKYMALCEGLRVDPWLALSGAPAPTTARVH